MYTDEDGNWYESMYDEHKNVNLAREHARKKALQLAVNRYFDGVKGARNKRYFYNDGKKLISEKDYRHLLSRHNSDLIQALSGLLRKDDRIKLPLQK